MKRKEYYLKMDNETLLFEGWEIPFKTNTQFSSFSMNAKINLVGERETIQDWVENKNLNKEFSARHRILIYPEPYNIDNSDSYGRIEADAKAKEETKAEVDVIGWPVEASHSDDNIDDILSTAFEGGSNDWIEKVIVVDGDYKGTKYASDAVSKGAELVLEISDHPDERLNKEKMLEGLKKYEEKNGKRLDMESYDAGDADEVLQLAVFGEAVFG